MKTIEEYILEYDRLMNGIPSNKNFHNALYALSKAIELAKSGRVGEKAKWKCQFCGATDTDYCLCVPGY